LLYNLQGDKRDFLFLFLIEGDKRDVKRELKEIYKERELDNSIEKRLKFKFKNLANANMCPFTCLRIKYKFVCCNIYILIVF